MITCFYFPETFTVHVPGRPVSATVGSIVTLPCGLSPSFNASTLHVRWDQPDSYQSPILYRDRVSLAGELEKGDVSLMLENITLADGGQYMCFVESKAWYEEGQMSLSIRVLGSPPLLSLSEAEQLGQVNVTCSSFGWFPQPELTWKDKEGRLMNNSNVEGLVTVNSWLLLSFSETPWISCSVSLSDLERRESRVVLKNVFTDQYADTWKIGFFTVLALLLLILVVIILIILTWCKKGTRLIKFVLIPVNCLIKEVRCKNPQQPAGHEEQHLHVLCKHRLGCDQHYWEVVGFMCNSDPGGMSVMRQSCYAGVCSDRAVHEHSVPLTHGNGFWLLCHDMHCLYVNTTPVTRVSVEEPFETLGVFLDFNQEILYFYNADKKALICTLPIPPNRTLIPLITHDAYSEICPLHLTHHPE
uniref:Ig-like domain-containing protein n=1 Tax=Denticeps clupeoides TaxID=299321 RepID=A0AAY4A2F8_9TELE